MKQGREDLKKTTITYLHDAASQRTVITIDVDVPEDDMPHEHRLSLREQAEELLGVPMSEIEAMGVEVKLKSPHAHPHPHPEEPVEQGLVQIRKKQTA